ncbi:MAG: hypothetical protein ABI806_19925 [Candidatus Solibacter sp.]
MSREAPIPVLHQVIAAAAVKAILGDRAVIREMVEVPAPSAIKRAGALKYGIRTFWRRWTARQSNGSSTTNETPD